MVIYTQIFSTLVELCLLLVEVHLLAGGASLWWSSFFTQLRLRPVVEVLSLTTAAVLTLSAVVERWVWHRPVHTAMQLSKQVSYLLCTRPRVRSP